MRVTKPDGTILVITLALIAALTISFGIALVIGLRGYADAIHEEFRLRSSRLAESGCLLSLDSLMMTPSVQDTISVDPNSRIVRSIKPWGVTYRLNSLGIAGALRSTRLAVLGGTLPPNLDAAITATDTRYPLTLSGSTIIQGDIHCGPAGIQNGTLAGGGGDTTRKFSGSLEIHRNLTIPSIDLAVLSAYEHELMMREQNVPMVPGSMLFSEAHPVGDYALRVEGSVEFYGYQQPKAGNALKLYAGGQILIDGQTRLNNCDEIVSTRYIRLSGNAVLNTSLLVAEDSLVLDGHATFSGCVLCRGSVVVRDNAAFRWPCLVVTLPRAPDSGRSRVTFLSRQYSEGLIFAGRLPGDSTSTPCIYVDSQSVFAGYLVSQGEVELRGQLFGKVMTERFMFHKSASTYVNWIHNGTVRDVKLPFHPLLPALASVKESQYQPLDIRAGQ